MPRTSVEYDETVMEQLFRRGDWQSWDDCIQWLKSAAYQAGDLAQEHIQSLLAHFMRLKDQQVPFPLDYREAFRLVQLHCNTEA